VDLIVFERLRTLATTEIDIVEALKEKPAEPVDDVLWNMHVSTKEMMDDEYMADIIQESGDAFLAGMNLDRPPPPLPPTNEERLQSLFSRKGASARNNPHPEQPSPQLSHSRPRRPNQLSMRQTRRVFIPKSRLPRKLEETVDV
jgi:hypothetical protein